MIKYQLKDNAGDNNDCLIISIGRLADPSLSEADALAHGWLAIEDGIDQSDNDKLLSLYELFKQTYQGDMTKIGQYLPLALSDAHINETKQTFIDELKDLFGGAELSPDIIESQWRDKLQSDLRDFIQQLKMQTFQKDIGLLYALPANNRKSVITTSWHDLDNPKRFIGLYESFRDHIATGEVPQLLVHNGGHFSNVVPYITGNIEINSEQDIKEMFVGLMNDGLMEAAGFTHLEALQSLSQERDFKYTIDILETDLKRATPSLNQPNNFDQCLTFMNHAHKQTPEHKVTDPIVP